jgi:ribose/xylose/arabinose/galactoside ABC-type transport system permease subunit
MKEYTGSSSEEKTKGRAVVQQQEQLLIRRLTSEEFVRYIPLILFAIVILILGFLVPRFLTVRNGINILRQASALGLMAIGITAVLVGGGIDLSIPSLMALGGIIGTMYMRGGGNPILGGLIMIAVCTLGGMINGYAVAYLKMIPFVVTLSMMYIAMGASVWLTREVSVAGLPSAFIDTIMANIWLIPVPVIFLFIVTTIVTFLMRNNLYGRWLYAVGSRPETARSLGVPKDRIIFGTYVFSGFFAGLAAIISTARLVSASSRMGAEGVVLNVIASAVVGGVSIYGGVGSPLGAVIGAILITVIGNIMNLMHITYYMTLVVKGCVIVLIIALDSLYRRR